MIVPHNVVVANFSSVLEIAFAIDFLFVFFELKPIFDEKFWGIGRRFGKTFETLWENGWSAPHFLVHLKWESLQRVQ
jgi:hypothetical protein